MIYLIKFLILSLLGLAALFFIFKNVYFFIILFLGFSVFSVYLVIKNIIDRKISKTKVSSRSDLYCKEQGEMFIFWMLWPTFLRICDDLNFKYILENFSKVTFKEQFLFMFTISGFIWVLCILIMFINVKIGSKKGIVYKEGLILQNGKLYSFDNVRSYEFKTSFKGMKYRDLILTYNGEFVKTVCIYKDDIDKFKELLEKNCQG